MKELVILQGIPAGGKTTWAKQYVIDHADTHVRVCRDDLRRMRGKYWLPNMEYMISQWEKTAVEESLKAGYSVILDATNLNFKYLRGWVELGVFHGAEIKFKRFDATVEECIERDSKRDEKVGEEVIRRMYKSYLQLDETMAKVEPMLLESTKVERIVQDPSLPKAIICDLDGTLALHNGRSPFEYEKCDTDVLNTSVAAALSLFHDSSHRTIIYLSGREDWCREKTEKWLRNHFMFPDGLLYMRPTGDSRRDCIVKKEIFDREVKGKYFVEVCFEDRDQMVKLWRDLGFSCFQVNYGNF